MVLRTRCVRPWMAGLLAASAALWACGGKSRAPAFDVSRDPGQADGLAPDMASGPDLAGDPEALEGDVADLSGAEGRDPESESRDWWSPPDSVEDEHRQPPPPQSCGFTWDFEPYQLPPPQDAGRAGRPPPLPLTPDPISWLDPYPPALHVLPLPGGRGDIVLPAYSDDLPLFERAGAWTSPYRCYETPVGPRYLDEEQAWEMYRDIAEQTTGQTMATAPGVRTVVGIRGAYPGTFLWHGNDPDLFNDTLVLLWLDEAGDAHVREFPVNTDSGAYPFGWHSSSSLRPNRRFLYRNGWHKSYSALAIDEVGYIVRDDANKNGHWDSDRNGWYPPDTADDHDRVGSGHNIHMASVDAPLGWAHVQNWSAGCQTIPGIANWIEFITHAWSGTGDAVSYYLVDVRDIDSLAWGPCTPDGSHACPHRIPGFPFSAASDTSVAASGPDGVWDQYNCSPADESGPEELFVLTVGWPALLHVALDDIPGTGPDIDIHLLDGNDPLACLVRDDLEFSWELLPGRYWLVADTYVQGGQPLPGPYVLDAWLE